MRDLLLGPPLAFVIILVVSMALSYATSFLSFKRTVKKGHLEKAYTGGEIMATNRVQPNYSEFFPFAFFFTILHVVTLIIATSPTYSVGSFIIAVIYIMGAVMGLLILFRR